MRNYWNDSIRWGRLVWVIQMFFGTLLLDNEMIIDNSFVSRVRSYLGKDVDFEEFQRPNCKHLRALHQTDFQRKGE